MLVLKRRELRTLKRDHDFVYVENGLCIRSVNTKRLCGSYGWDGISEETLKALGFTHLYTLTLFEDSNGREYECVDGAWVDFDTHYPVRIQLRKVAILDGHRLKWGSRRFKVEQATERTNGVTEVTIRDEEDGQLYDGVSSFHVLDAYGDALAQAEE